MTEEKPDLSAMGARLGASGTGFGENVAKDVDGAFTAGAVDVAMSDEPD